MTDRLLPLTRPARYAHLETESAARFAALLDRLIEREAERDPTTGLTAAEASHEDAYRLRSRYSYHRRIESAHNPLLLN